MDTFPDEVAKVYGASQAMLLVTLVQHRLKLRTSAANPSMQGARATPMKEAMAATTEDKRKKPTLQTSVKSAPQSKSGTTTASSKTASSGKAAAVSPAPGARPPAGKVARSGGEANTFGDEDCMIVDSPPSTAAGGAKQRDTKASDYIPSAFSNASSSSSSSSSSARGRASQTAAKGASSAKTPIAPKPLIRRKLTPVTKSKTPVKVASKVSAPSASASKSSKPKSAEKGKQSSKVVDEEQRKAKASAAALAGWETRRKKAAAETESGRVRDTEKKPHIEERVSKQQNLRVATEKELKELTKKMKMYEDKIAEIEREKKTSLQSKGKAKKDKDGDEDMTDDASNSSTSDEGDRSSSLSEDETSESELELADGLKESNAPPYRSPAKSSKETIDLMDDDDSGTKETTKSGRKTKSHDRESSSKPKEDAKKDVEDRRGKSLPTEQKTAAKKEAKDDRGHRDRKESREERRDRRMRHVRVMQRDMNDATALYLTEQIDELPRLVDRNGNRWVSPEVRRIRSQAANAPFRVQRRRYGGHPKRYGRR